MATRHPIHTHTASASPRGALAVHLSPHDADSPARRPNPPRNAAPLALNPRLPRYSWGMSDGPNYQLRLAQAEDQADLRRMYAELTTILHRYDESIEAGRLLEDDWWKKPDDLFAYLVDVQGKAVGFLLVAGKRYVDALEETGDFILWEMFLEAEQRGSGLAESAANEVFRRHPGEWSLVAMPNNGPAIGFWRRILPALPGGVREEAEADGFVKFRFATT